VVSLAAHRVECEVEPSDPLAPLLVYDLDVTQEPIKLDYGVQRDDAPPPPAPWTPWQKGFLLTLIVMILLLLISALIELVRWLRLAMYA
jgi:hypothetical protein